jgi:hypothetical protein
MVARGWEQGVGENEELFNTVSVLQDENTSGDWLHKSVNT